MRSMKLVINISEELKEVFVNQSFIGSDCFEMGEVLEKGILLPEGHGDLKDESDLDLFDPNIGTDEYVDDLMAKHDIDYVNGDDEDKVRAFALDLIDSCMNVIKTAPTIIEAESEEL